MPLLIASHSPVSAALLEVVPALSVVVAVSLGIVRSHGASVLLKPPHRDALPVPDGSPTGMPPAHLSLAR